MKRGRWQGAIRILVFNRGWYGCGVAAVACAVAGSVNMGPPWRGVLLAGAVPALFWLAGSIAVSHYIYDGSRLYEFEWLADCLAEPPRRWVSIHAGLDEIRGVPFLSGEGRKFDIFDPNEMTEPSIRRAR